MEIFTNSLKRGHPRFLVATISLAAVTFIVDMSLPLGHVVWLPYVIVVLLSLWAPHRHYALGLATACTVLIFLGFLFCPPGGLAGDRLL